MKDINRVVMAGRLVRDSEVKMFTNNGCVSFTVATNRSVKKGDQWVDEASFFDCKYFTKAAEKLQMMLVKGKQVFLDGTLVQETWEKDGKKNSKVVIYADSVQLGSGGGEKPTQVVEEKNGFSNDIPF